LISPLSAAKIKSAADFRLGFAGSDVPPPPLFLPCLFFFLLVLGTSLILLAAGVLVLHDFLYGFGFLYDGAPNALTVLLGDHSYIT
jgi:hypothetical protein